MNPALIFIGAGAASLFWTAACTAAGVRCYRPWLRRLLLVLGLLAPLLTLLPWLVGTSMLAFLSKLEANWFGPVLSLFISALIGGSWILKSGTQPRGGGWPTVPAATWLVGILFALFLLAKAGTAGALLLLDRTAFAASSRLYVEASDLMKVNLPPAETDNTNAAGLYAAALESQFNGKWPGILSAVILPSFSGALRAEARSRVRHRAAQAAVAATRMRLETGSLPKNLTQLVPSAFPAPPLDLFTADQPLQYRMTDDALLIYSVGPNGVDDGGPSGPEADGESSNDDIGLRLSIH